MDELIDLRTLNATEPTPERIEVPVDATPVEFLQAVYRSPAVPLHSRLKAAIEAAQYVHPRLSVSAFVDGSTFAERLERAIERSGKLIEHEPSTIEPQPEEA